MPIAKALAGLKAARHPAPGTPVAGTYQRTTSPFGCYTTVAGGKVEGTICVD